VKRFECPSCSASIHFENQICLQCSTELAYRPDRDVFSSIDPAPCANRGNEEVCNWAADGGSYCGSCRLDTDHLPTELRRPFQLAKRRALRQLIQLGVDLERDPPLGFELRQGTDAEPVTIGHADGLITLDTAEGDPTELATVRTSLGEPYRTPLGHVRHELGHWYWASHIGGRLATGDFRRRFGDERADYGAALEEHYASGDDGAWQASHVSHYAAAHPLEDFAESFAHCLHILDTLETARSYGILAPPGGSDQAGMDFDADYACWVDLTVAINEINRSMGTPDSYPFAPSPIAVEKIRFIACVVMG
jgi:hypothetical protein